MWVCRRCMWLRQLQIRPPDHRRDLTLGPRIQVADRDTLASGQQRHDLLVGAVLRTIGCHGANVEERRAVCDRLAGAPSLNGLNNVVAPCCRHPSKGFWREPLNGHHYMVIPTIWLPPPPGAHNVNSPSPTIWFAAAHIMVHIVPLCAR